MNHEYHHLALFDLDHTLLPFDSDHGWIEYLISKDLIKNPNEFRSKNDELFRLYNEGKLDVAYSLSILLSVLTMHSPIDLAKYHEEYMAKVVRPKILPQALSLVDKHMQAGDLCCLVSATNTFVITPIARAFGFQHVIGTIPEHKNGRYTGQSIGVPSYREGKITRVNEWLNQMGLALTDFEQSWFYSDSRNDIPLMSLVTNPVATNPDNTLRAYALEKGWKVLDLFAS